MPQQDNNSSDFANWIASNYQQTVRGLLGQGLFIDSGPDETPVSTSELIVEGVICLPMHALFGAMWTPLSGPACPLMCLLLGAGQLVKGLSDEDSFTMPETPEDEEDETEIQNQLHRL